MTSHNKAEKGEIAKTVLMPGDPLRAKYIAENFMQDIKLVNNVRGMFAYTGTYKGKPVSVMGSGMGNPSMGIYSYELYTEYEVDNIIRIGTTGAYKGATEKEMNLRDVVLAEKSYSKSSYAKMQCGYEKDVIDGSKELINVIKQTAEEKAMRVHVGTVNAVETIYGEYPEIEDGKNANCISGEMESFALYTNAMQLGKRAACILTVSNILPYIKGEPELSTEERQTAVNDMIVLALETVLKL